jgi:MATE family multidrug resistance protein
MEMGAFSVLAVMISVLSETQMAAHQIVMQIIHFSFLPAVAINSATSVLCGQAVGAMRRDLVRVVSRRAFAIAGGYMGIFSLALIVFGRLMVSAFSDDPRVLQEAWLLIRIAIVFQIFDAANIVARGALQGTGDVRFAAVVGITLSWVFTPPLMWLLGYRLGLGAAGGWIGMSLEIMLGASLLWWRLEKGKWHRSADRVASLAVPVPATSAVG